MANTKAKRHVHKYNRIFMSGTPLWACALPTCNHYMPKHMEMMVEGKMSICWDCGKEFILDEENMMVDKPNCGCVVRKKTDTEKMAEILKEFGVK